MNGERPRACTSDEVEVETLDGPVSAVLGSLGLLAEKHPACPRATVLRTPQRPTPLAAVLDQGASHHDDRDAIEALKAFDRELPIIFVARTTNPRRETAIRQLSIHYFLAEPVEASELKLVLEALVRSTYGTSRATHSFERYFTR